MLLQVPSSTHLRAMRPLYIQCAHITKKTYRLGCHNDLCCVIFELNCLVYVISMCGGFPFMVQFIFSTAVDGKIKAWLYDNLGSRVDYDAPGRWCTTMAYSQDGSRFFFTGIFNGLCLCYLFMLKLMLLLVLPPSWRYHRLFSCGTSKDGESHIVEWNESEGAVKRTYQGFRKRSLGVIQFDTTKNRYLAAGDDFSIKFWDMDNVQLLTTIEADGGLPVSLFIQEYFLNNLLFSMGQRFDIYLILVRLYM